MQSDYSVIVTSFNEAATIGTFIEKLHNVLETKKKSFEIVLVDDGSKDETFNIACGLMSRFSNLTVVASLFRNSGQGAAMAAASTLASGRHFAVIDSDLQLDPNDLAKIIEEFEKGYDVVNGYRVDRQDPFFRRTLSFFANNFFRFISKSQLRDFGCNMRVFRGELVRSLGFGCCKAFSSVEVLSISGPYFELPISHFKRATGQSGWKLRWLLSTFFDNLVNLSDRPFQYFAVFLVFAAMLVLVRLVFASLSTFSVLRQVTNGLIINALLMQGLILMAGITILGEMSLRSLRKLQSKPLYVFRKIKRRDMEN